MYDNVMVGTGKTVPIPLPWKNTLSKYNECDPQEIIDNTVIDYMRQNYKVYDSDDCGDVEVWFIFDDGSIRVGHYEWWIENSDETWIDDYVWMEKTDHWFCDNLPEDISREWLLIRRWGTTWIGWEK